MKKIKNSVLAGIHRRQGIERIRTLENKLLTPSTRFAIPFTYQGKGFFKSIEPRQNLHEIEALYRMICSLAPQTVLEIGTARGGTLYLWAQAATSSATILSIDLPGGEFGGSYPACRIPFYQAFARENQKLHLLRADSHSPDTAERVRSLFGSQPVDFIFIDGDHTYEGVKSDFLQYSPLVRSGGIIAFHDILPRTDLPDIQVDRFWNEIRASYESEEIIGTEGTGRRIGIGIIRVR